MEFVGAEVNDALVVPREVNRCLPVEAQLGVADFARHGQPLHATEAGLVLIEPEIGSKLEARVDCAVVAPVHLHLHPVAAHDGFPGGQRRVFIGLGGSRPHTVVLQAAIDVVGFFHIHRDGVKLPQRLRVEVRPVLAAVVSHVHATVVAVDHMVGIIGVDPQRVVVGMDVFLIHVLPGLAPVF